MGLPPLTLEQARNLYEAAERALDEARTRRRAAEVAFVDADPASEPAAKVALDEARRVEEDAKAERWQARSELFRVETQVARERAASAPPPPQCSICRRHHGREVRHARE